jgi:hypothetical protein
VLLADVGPTGDSKVRWRVAMSPGLAEPAGVDGRDQNDHPAIIGPSTERPPVSKW